MSLVFVSATTTLVKVPDVLTVEDILPEAMVDNIVDVAGPGGCGGAGAGLGREVLKNFAEMTCTFATIITVSSSLDLSVYGDFEARERWDDRPNESWEKSYHGYNLPKRCT
jgi:hypothetical protein